MSTDEALVAERGKPGAVLEGITLDLVKSTLQKHPEGLRSDLLRKELGLDGTRRVRRSLAEFMRRAVAAKRVEARGVKRGRTFFAL